MATTTFLYIDDDILKDAAEKVQGFEQAGLKVLTNQHKGTWENQMKFIKENEATLDGLLLDLRLDDFPNEAGERADFRGTSLAQEIRTRQKEGEFKSFPIILFSGNDKLEKSLEKSGKDLFDICIDKGQINAKSYDILSPQLLALAEGYKAITQSASNLSGILNTNIEYVDERFISELNDLVGNPTHVIAGFLIHDMIEKQGLLIDEQVLAARLGIDIDKSSDWGKVISSLSPSKYTGVFSGGWHRWWMTSVNEWWRKVVNTEKYLRSTPASIRVNLIKKELGIEGLHAAEKIEKADSEEYWTMCKGYNRPLDPVDGLMIDGQENLYPWQDAEYVSIDAALKCKNNNAWKKVAKLEEERLTDLKEQFKKTR
ncbi:hypothetical protein [Proteiniphilum sp. X52]|uniref:hypothetical protein n=1 Tax=Proteiniphilum sp. X52 TaxID=2382159 RepID=UPI000F0A218E|nr:hypothetical protein [Proteiniphilum sp. X52]RNC64447.1 hypothetical protein D7D25_11100 [Proteiniphilum sp. X52]